LNVPETLAGLMNGFDSQFFAVMPYKGGEYGLANLYDVTKYKAQGWRFMWDQSNPSNYGSQPRGANATKHDFGGGRGLWFVNTHLGKVPGDEGVTPQRQLFELLGKLKTFDPDQPVIVVGDFNIKAAMPGPYAALLKLFDDPSLSGFELIYQDARMYIFRYDPHQRLIVRGSKEVSAHWQGIQLSDHKLLVAEFEWR
jgi:endonuclease/exonuclease/phosphatase (EEP) superfamily protein YafD